MHQGREAVGRRRCGVSELWVASLFSLSFKYKSSKPPLKFCARTSVGWWSAGGLHKPVSRLIIPSCIYRSKKSPDHLTLVHLSLLCPSSCHLFTAACSDEGGTRTSTVGRSPVQARAHTPFSHSFTTRGNSESPARGKREERANIGGD